MDTSLKEMEKRDPEEQLPSTVVFSLFETAIDFLGAIRPSIAPEVSSKYEAANRTLLEAANREVESRKNLKFALSSVRPFAIDFIEDCKTLDADARVPIAVAHKLLEAVVDAMNDPDFGLKAGRSTTASDVGALGFAMNSAASVREAIEVAVRYIRLVNDGLIVRLEAEGEKAIIQLESQVVLPKSAEDFLLSSFYRSLANLLLRDLSKVECWFVHAEPENADEYRRTFDPSNVRFAAPYCGFVFEKKYLDNPIEGADFKLHSILRKHADQMLAELPKSHNLAEKVRSLIAAELPHGQPRIWQIACQLSMSSRTLERRLENVGTTFTALLDDLRRGLAEKYVVSRDLSLSEVAFLLGFSHSAAFHRAFKRWTGQTPLVYRRTYRKQTESH